MELGKDYLNAVEATELLGVKMQTLYAYVSRGMVRSFPGKESKTRVYPARISSGFTFETRQCWDRRRLPLRP